MLKRGVAAGTDQADSLAGDRERVLGDIDGQIKDLRTRLAEVDESTEKRRREGLEKLSAMGVEADRIEGQLLHLASRFCGPLRSKPEMGQLFKELAADGKAAGR